MDVTIEKWHTLDRCPNIVERFLERLKRLDNEEFTVKIKRITPILIFKNHYHITFRFEVLKTFQVGSNGKRITYEFKAMTLSTGSHAYAITKRDGAYFRCDDESVMKLTET